MAVSQIYDLIPVPPPTPTDRVAGREDSLRGLRRPIQTSTRHNHALTLSSVHSAGPRVPGLGVFAAGTLSGWESFNNQQPSPDEHDCQMFDCSDALRHEAVNLNERYDSVTSCRQILSILNMSQMLRGRKKSDLCS